MESADSAIIGTPKSTSKNIGTAKSADKTSTKSASIATSKPRKFADMGWRIEVLKRGQYWQWRKGKGAERKCRYGGKFTNLSAERQAAYRENIKTHARTNA